jgi:hypothetical protein
MQKPCAAQLLNAQLDLPLSTVAAPLLTVMAVIGSMSNCQLGVVCSSPVPMQLHSKLGSVCDLVVA